MLYGRESEYAFLEENLKRPESRLIVLYGQKFLGKTSLVLDFCENRPFSYFPARTGAEKKVFEDMDGAFQRLSILDTDEKKIFIIDEFHYLAKTEGFMDKILTMMEKENILIILISSAISFIETGLVKNLGRDAAYIGGFHKVKELSFSAICRIYDDISPMDLFVIYSLFGGVIGLWNFFDPSLPIRDNLEKNLLSDRSYLYHTGYSFLTEGLRETGVYDTILATIAEGNTKLNDLHKLTGYSRAKISVYLKCLMEYELIRKAYSVDCPGLNNSQKGIYEISSHFTQFWFTFIYPHVRELTELSAEQFFDLFVFNHLLKYCNQFVPEIVREYFHRQGIIDQKDLVQEGRFLGKANGLELVFVTKEGPVTVWCRRLKTMVTYEDYLELVDAQKEAGFKDAISYMVSLKSFDEKLKLDSKMKSNIRLLTFPDILSSFKEIS